MTHSIREPQTLSATDYPNPKVRLARLPQTRNWLLNGLFFISATVVLGLVTTKIPWVRNLELTLDQNLRQNSNPTLDSIALAIHYTFEPLNNVIIVVALFAIVLIAARAPVNAAAIGAAITLTWLSAEIPKLIIAEPRPDHLTHVLVREVGTDSFPSGHTAFVAALAIALCYLARGTRYRFIAPCLGAIAVLAIAASRIYLGVHFISDVIGSLLWVAGIMLIFTGLWNRYGLNIVRRAPVLTRFGPVPAK